MLARTKWIIGALVSSRFLNADHKVISQRIIGDTLFDGISSERQAEYCLLRTEKKKDFLQKITKLFSVL